MTPVVRYRIDVDERAALTVWFVTERGEVVDYAVVLTVAEGGSVHTVRVYDYAHGVNEVHRHARAAGKQAGVPFHHGTAGEAMRAARAEVLAGYATMIEAWRQS